MYVGGLAALWQRAGAGRGVGAWRAASFGLGWVSLVVALDSPLDSLGEYLFSAHMVQHEILMLVASPLLVVGRPIAVWVWALPLVARRWAGRLLHAPAWRVPWLWISAPIPAWILHALALWVWHVPNLFEAALADQAIHTAQHLTFFFSALLFWWSVLGSVTRNHKGIALVSLFTTMVHTGALGALLTLSSTSWYPSYASTAPEFDLTAIEDQQLGGLVMWVPAGFVYLICGLALAASWLNRAPVAAIPLRPV
jgi:putative membrane protein